VIRSSRKEERQIVAGSCRVGLTYLPRSRLGNPKIQSSAHVKSWMGARRSRCSTVKQGTLRRHFVKANNASIGLPKAKKKRAFAIGLHSWSSATRVDLSLVAGGAAPNSKLEEESKSGVWQDVDAGKRCRGSLESPSGGVAAWSGWVALSGGPLRNTKLSSACRRPETSVPVRGY
jgi:hypothetical protein